MYAGSSDGFVYKTTDGGRAWRLASGGLIRRSPAGVDALAIDPRTPTTIYMGSAHGVVEMTDAGGVFKSTDGGKTWKQINRGLPSPNGTPSANDIVIDPRSPRTIYLGGYGDLWEDDGAGVFKSTDAGETWAMFSRGLAGDGSGGRAAEKLAIDARGLALYAGTRNGVFDFRYAR